MTKFGGWLAKAVWAAVAAVVLAVDAVAATGTVDGVEWTYSVDSGGNAKITGGPEEGAIVIPDEIDAHSVTGIGSWAFADCTGLTSVVIPGGVARIGMGAFAGCTGLTSVVISEGVADIGTWAFDSCTGLETVAIPASVEEVYGGAFGWCSGVSAFAVAEGNANYRVEDGVLYSADQKTLVAVPGGKIGGFEVPDGTEIIEEYAFSGCGGLTNLVVCGSVTDIGSGAFEGCEGLVAVSLGGGVAKLPAGPFADSGALEYIEVAEANESFCAVDGVLFTKDQKTLVQYPRGKEGEGYEVPEGTEDIGERAFAFCGGLEYVMLPAGVTNIGYAAFRGCTGLFSVDLPDSVAGIDSQAFQDCKALQSVNLGQGVADIGSHAFEGCAALESAALPASVTRLGNDVFAKCDALAALRVPGEWMGTEMLAEAGVPEGCKVVYTGFKETVDGLEWTYTVCDGSASVGNGDYRGDRAVPPATAGEIAIPDTLGGYPVTGVGTYAFYYCTNLTGVAISDGVTDIGVAAFGECRNLAGVTIPAGVTNVGELAFSRCTALERIDVAEGNPVCESEDGVLFDKGKTTLLQYPCGKAGAYAIPAGVTRIAMAAFQECVNLTSVVVPDGVAGIGAGAFALCSRLAELVLPASVTEIGMNAFASSGLRGIVVPGAWLGTEMLDGTGLPTGCVVVYVGLSETVDGVEWSYAVYGGQALVTGDSGHPAIPPETAGDIAVPGTLGGCPVIAIAINAFLDCRQLTAVEIPGSVTEIGGDAFAGCTGLTGVTIPEGVRGIGQRAFFQCTGLTAVTIPASVTSVGTLAFAHCDALERIDVAEGNTVYESVDGVLVNKAKKMLVQFPGGRGGAYEIPDGVAGLGAGAFRYCGNLTSVTIPGSVGIIGQGAFRETGLTNVFIPAGVTNILSEPFAGCRFLESIEVDPENPAFTSMDGVLFTKNLETLVQCPGGKGGAWEIPDGAGGIAKLAFEGCAELTALTIPDSVTRIGADAFSGSGLTTLTVPGAWKGTNLLAGTGVPEGCEVVYRPERLAIKSITIRSGENPCVTIEYAGEAVSVEGTDDLTGQSDDWATVDDAVIDGEKKTATVPMGKRFLRLAAAVPTEPEP